MHEGFTSRGCIICGRDNPVGLHAKYEPVDTGVRAEVTPGEHFQGFDGVLQGGIIAGLLDDAMWWAVYARGHITVTAELTVRYKAPVRVEVPLVVTGSVAGERRSVFFCNAQIQDGEGVILAEASGKFMRAPRDMEQRMLEQTGRGSA